MPSAVVPPRHVVRTQYGDVVGHDAGGIRYWKGVPFAAAGRFTPARPPTPWTRPRDAHHVGPVAPQLGPQGQVLGNEDCLTLNIWAPPGVDVPMPVLFWIHGGAFVTGSGADYDGGYLAATGPAVVVTVNYRLGPLGFLHLQHLGGVFESSGNPALTDLMSALRWVSTNIEGFGGDPGQVTLMGQSAGAALVCSLLGVPAVRGLYRRAFAFSTTGGRNAVPDEAAEVTDRLLHTLGLDARSAARLLDVPVGALLAAGRAVEAGELPWQPVVDGVLLPSQPVDAVQSGAVRDIPLWLGWCRDEMAGFCRSDPLSPLVSAVESRVRRSVGEAGWEGLVSAYRSAARDGEDPREALLADVMWRHPAVELAEAQADAGGPVWMSRFDHTPSLPPFPRLGPSHGADNACLWAHVPAFVDRPLLGRPGGPMTDVDVEVTRDLHRSVLAGPDWPRYERVRRETAVFGTPFTVVEDPDGDRRHLWDAVRERRGAGLP